MYLCSHCANLHANAEDVREEGLNPKLGRFPWRRVWQPTPIFLSRESHGELGGLQSTGSKRVRPSWRNMVSGLKRDPSKLSKIRHVPHLLFPFSLFMLLTLSSCECQTFLMAISFRLHFLPQTKTDSFGPDSQLIKISLSDGLLNLPDVAFKAPVGLVSHRKAGW